MLYQLVVRQPLPAAPFEESREFECVINCVDYDGAHDPARVRSLLARPPEQKASFRDYLQELLSWAEVAVLAEGLDVAASAECEDAVPRYSVLGCAVTCSYEGGCSVRTEVPPVNLEDEG